MGDNIKPEDLRIGNMLKQGVVESITKTTAFCYIPKRGQTIFQPLCTGNHYEYDKLEPIELTNDILNSLGFKEIYKYKDNTDGLVRMSRIDGDTFQVTNCIKESVGNHRKFMFDSKPGHLVIMAGLKHKIKYLHQFQNVYSIFTGEEL